MSLSNSSRVYAIKAIDDLSRRLTKSSSSLSSGKRKHGPSGKSAKERKMSSSSSSASSSSSQSRRSKTKYDLDHQQNVVGGEYQILKHKNAAGPKTTKEESKPGMGRPGNPLQGCLTGSLSYLCHRTVPSLGRSQRGMAGVGARPTMSAVTSIIWHRSIRYMHTDR